MQGYSVTEAASILGVPTERVWELLARGVLAGAPEGETGMRVYLQPRPAPAPPVPDPIRPNGDAAASEPQRELSPFRELLTEFRNLTERYGQALLALGEARGEVAALRSRVDLLEARMDLRLPMSGGVPMAPPAPWPPPISSAAAPHPPDAAVEHDDEEDRPRRRRTHRRATESFAEALARAEDPSPPELPGVEETAAAMAAHRHEATHDAATAEAVLPRELPAAEAIPLVDEPELGAAAQSAEPTSEVPEAAVPEPEPVVPEPEVPEAEPESVAAEPEPVAAEPEPVATEPEPVATEPEPVATELEAAEPAGVATELEPVATELQAAEPAGVAAEPESAVPEPEPVATEPEPVAAELEAAEPAGVAESEAAVGELGAVPEPGDQEPAEPEVEQPEATVAAVEPEASAELRPEPHGPEADQEEPVVAEVEPIAWDPERYTVEIVEPDWYAEDEVDPFAARPVSTDGGQLRAPEEKEEQRASAELPPAEEAPGTQAAAPVEPEPPAEETMLWFGRAPEPSRGAAGAAADEGADEMEVAGASRSSAPGALPGGRELDEALAALDAIAARQPADLDAGSAPPARARVSEADDTPAATVEPSAGTLTSLTRPPTTPATRAYRRLRRIFPG